jgi:hypothetical protein
MPTIAFALKRNWSADEHLPPAKDVLRNTKELAATFLARKQNDAGLPESPP